MPDLLAHALFAYAAARVASWRYDWLSAPYVTAVMAGAFVPDLAKVTLVAGPRLVSDVLGLPFGWFSLHTLGGALLSVLVGVVLVGARERRRVLVLLGTGAASHLALDALLSTPSGRSYPLLWPLTRYVPPTPGLYLSTDWQPTAVAAALALAVLLADRFLVARGDTT